MSGRVLVYGGRGALGAAVVEHFKSKGWLVFSVDIHQNDNANANIIVGPSDTLEKQVSNCG